MHYRRWAKHGTPEPTGPTVTELFWAKVNKTPTCWLWTASTSHRGYGLFSVKRRNTHAHRFAYERLVGPIPDGLVVDHLCYTRACVNPAHMQLVTPQKNNENRAGASRNSKTGVRGVSWDKAREKFVAEVKVNGRKYHVGRFGTVAEAEAAVIDARNRLMTNNLRDRKSA